MASFARVIGVAVLAGTALTSVRPAEAAVRVACFETR
jgi:hypothetical protein